MKVENVDPISRILTMESEPTIDLQVMVQTALDLDTEFRGAYGDDSRGGFCQEQRPSWRLRLKVAGEGFDVIVVKLLLGDRFSVVITPERQRAWTEPSWDSERRVMFKHQMSQLRDAYVRICQRGTETWLLVERQFDSMILEFPDDVTAGGGEVHVVVAGHAFKLEGRVLKPVWPTIPAKKLANGVRFHVIWYENPTLAAQSLGVDVQLPDLGVEDREFWSQFNARRQAWRDSFKGRIAMTDDEIDRCDPDWLRLAVFPAKGDPDHPIELWFDLEDGIVLRATAGHLGEVAALIRAAAKKGGLTLSDKWPGCVVAGQSEVGGGVPSLDEIAPLLEAAGFRQTATMQWVLAPARFLTG